MAGLIVRDEKVGTGRYIELSFTSSTTADEFEITGVPTQATITRLTAVLISGTGTTVNPAVGRTTGFTTGQFDELGSDIDGSPAARVSTVANNEVALPDRSLFVQPRVDSGTNNVIRMELHIQDGWESGL